MADLAKYVVALEAQTAQYVRELEKANKKLEGFEKRNQAALGALKKGFVALAGVLSVRMFAGYIKGQLDAADSMAKLANRLSTTTEFLSEMQHVAELTGVQFQTFTNSLQGFQRRLGESALGLGEARVAFKALGLDTTKLLALPLEQQFSAIAAALSGVQNETTRAGLAAKIFGEQGVALLQIINQGTGGIDAMRAEANSLGRTLSSDTAEAAERANDAITRLKGSLDGLARQTLPTVAGALEVVITGWTRMLFGTDPVPFEQAINRTQARVDFLKSSIETIKAGNPYDRQLPSLIEEYDELVAKLEEVNTKQQMALGVGLGGMTKKSPIADAVKSQNEQVANLLRQGMNYQAPLPLFYFEPLKLGDLSAEMAAESQAAFAQLKQDLRTQEEAIRDSYERRLKIIQDNTEAGSQAQLALLERLDAQTQQQLDALSEKAPKAFEQLGRSLGGALQDALADSFLGIETDFKQLLARMAAEALSNAVLSAIFSSFGGPLAAVGSFLGFGGTRHTGGPASAGNIYSVEPGEMFFEPHATGRVEPMGKGGATLAYAPVYNIAAGVTRQELVVALRVHDQRQKAELKDLMSRGRF